MKKLLCTVLLTALLAALPACAQPDTTLPGNPEDAAPQAPAEPDAGESGGGNADETPEEDVQGILESFESEDLDGNEAGGALFEGYEVNMINVWATYCGPCLSEMPELGELAEEYADKGVQIVGLVSDLRTRDGGYDQELRDLAKEIVKETGAAYVHLMPSDDLTARVLSQIQAVPTTFFVDETGAQIGQVVVGAKDKAGWKAVLDELLQEQEDAE